MALSRGVVMVDSVTPGWNARAVEVPGPDTGPIRTLTAATWALPSRQGSSEGGVGDRRVAAGAAGGIVGRADRGRARGTGAGRRDGPHRARPDADQAGRLVL